MAPVTTPRSTDAQKLKNKAKASLALLLIAVISISTATYAWFTLSNSTSVQSMIVEVSTGVTLKAYAGSSPGTDITKYFSVIKSEGTTGTIKPGEIITDALPGLVNGVTIDSLEDIKLWPVTSGDGALLYTQGGNVLPGAAAVVERKYYLQLTMTFLADTDMDVYLNGADSASGAGDGTSVAPEALGDLSHENAVKALRISFEDALLNTAVIYEPEAGLTGTTLAGAALRDSNSVGNPGSDQATFVNLGDNSGRYKGSAANESPVLFSLKKGVPKEIIIRMWVEGEDAECKNNDTINIEKAKMSIRLRFSGADASGNFIEIPGV